MMPPTEACCQPHVYSALSEPGHERHLLCSYRIPADVGRYPGGDRLAPRLARRGDVPSPVNPDRSEQRGLASRLRDILATSVRPVNSAIHCCAYSRALATFSCIPGTTRSVLIRTGAGAK